MSPIVRTIEPPSLRDTRPIYSHVATVNSPTKLIYTAGQIGIEKSGQIPKDYEEQVQLALKNLGVCLKSAGATVKDIIKLTYYIVNYTPENRPHARILEHFLGGHRPPATLVPVTALALPGLLFEIEAVLAVPIDTPTGQSFSQQILPANGGPLDVDVIVIGAGLSGLQAAHDVLKAGLSYAILEARDRVGGKVWSKPAEKGWVDLGAAWVNDTNQSKVWALGQKLGLEFVEQLTVGNCVMQEGRDNISLFLYGETPKFVANDQKDLVRVRDLFEQLCHTIDIRRPVGHDSLTLQDFMLEQDAGSTALSTVAIWTRAMLGVEPSELSALYFLDYCKSGGGLMQMRSDRKNGGQYLRCTTGMGSLPNGLASLLDPASVHLNSPVSAITQGNHGRVTVTTRDGSQHLAKKVICSIPTPLYKEIKFIPALPVDKFKMSESTSLGYYAKMILVYGRNWWKESGFCGLSQSFIGPASITRDSSNASAGHHSLTCFIVGEPGRVWSRSSQDERKAQILAQVATMFGPEHEEAAKNPTEVYEQEWAKEEFSKGCPCPVMPPNTLSRFSSALRAPFGDVHFVGTETSYEWKGYMDGALRSGERGASEVIEALNARPRETKL
ncbi:MAG: hypothetical protein M1818_005571 [Claussenomyces sp. TS43310]|nr:MAG: hypothetical protein M1818_005571 [Claussenomyces sp. TS43310]